MVFGGEREGEGLRKEKKKDKVERIDGLGREGLWKCILLHDTKSPNLGEL